MPRRYVVLAALLAFLVAGFYSSAALCCNADGIGTTKQPTVAAATVQPASTPAPAPEARPAAASKAALASRPEVTAGAAATSEDAGNNLGDSVGASPGTHKRGLRWQSFLPGVIK